MLPQHVLPRDVVLERLNPVFPVLFDSFFTAWDRLQDALGGHEDLSAHLSTSTRAGVVSDMFGHYAMPRLHEEHNAVITRVGRLSQAVIAQQIAIRFKKVDAELLAKNVETANQERIYNQDQTLPGLGPLCSLTFAYLLDSLGQKPVAIYLTCPRTMQANHWIAELWHEGEGRLDLFGTPSDLPDSGEIAPAADVDIKVPDRARKEA